MECRSERFQIARKASSLQTLQTEDVRSSQVDKTRKTQYFDEHKQEPNPLKNVQLWYYLSLIPKLLYVCVLSCFKLISKCVRIIICQFRQQTHDKERCSSAEQSNWRNSWRGDLSNSKYIGENSSRLSFVQSSAGAYSSDSEEDWNWIDNPTGGSSSDPQLSNAIDDHELPFVRFIDNILYFVNLYRVNYPAFVQEFSTSFYNWKCLSSGENWDDKREPVAYGHNLDPRKKRSGLIKNRVDILKKREFKVRMSQVRGDDHKGWILKIALVSRLIILLIQMFCRSLPSCQVPEETYGKLLDPLVNKTLGGYVNWDAHFFLHISVYGYTSENIMAFFPLLPMTLYIPSRIVYFFFGFFVSISSITIVLGVMLNTWLFLKCAENIYELAALWSGGSNQFITTACVMFSFNPASIFFSGLYTETLFAYLTSKVILSLLERKYWTAVVCCALSGICRSNGILNIGFILALLLQRELLKKGENFRTRFMNFVVRSVLIMVTAIFPFYLYQVYGINKFCSQHTVYDPNSVPLYCIPSSGFPLPYSYVQKKYWNVGFLEYFQVKQIPNFVLAFPALYILGTESCKALKVSVLQMKNQRTVSGIYYSAQALHGVFLTVFSFFFVHVQVSTRMIMSACPYLYTFVADSHLMELEKFRKGEIVVPRASLAITMWCILYYLVGTVGFCLGLPWT